MCASLSGCLKPAKEEHWWRDNLRLLQTFTSVSVQEESFLAWEQSAAVSDELAGNLYVI